MPQKQSRKPKSHRGCTACRASKRKCSEDKPACENCIRDGKDCEYDIDVLFRIQTYDGTQQPNRRMRQIITPLPKVQERDGASPQGSRRSSPSGSAHSSDAITEYPTPRRGSVAMSFLSDSRRRRSSQSSHGLQTPPASHNPTPAIDMNGFSPSLPTSLASSLSLDSYTYGLMDMPNPTQSSPTKRINLLTEDESAFVGYFLREMPLLLPFAEMFPSVCNDIWAMSLTHIPLTQSILAISSYLADRRSGISSINGLAFLEKALNRVQEAIAIGIVDEGLIAAVFLLAFLNTLSGDYKSARRHLQGMCQLLQCYHQRRACCLPPEPSPFLPNGYAIVMLLWRIAIRMEYHVAFYDAGHGPPIFPIVNTSQESSHIDWVSQIIDKNIPNSVQWALASFALDDLMNRAGHLSYKLSERQLNSMDRAFQIQELVDEHHNWKRREVVSQAIMENLSSSSVTDTTINPSLMHTGPTFLNYPPPTRIQNSIYATLLIRHFMTGIYLSLISDPCPGPVSPERFQAAIDICRYFVALYGDPPYAQADLLLRPVDNCMALITAGFTFREENYPNEFGYCIKTLSAIARETGFTALLDVMEILKVTHADTGCDNNWAKEYQSRMAATSAFRWDGLDVGLHIASDMEGLGQVVF